MSYSYVEFDKNLNLRLLYFCHEKNGKDIGIVESCDCYKLFYVLDGKGYLDGRLCIKDQGFLICPNERHEYHSDEHEPWQYFSLHFDGEEAAATLEECGIGSFSTIFDYNFRNKLASLFNIIFPSPTHTVSSLYGAGILNLVLAMQRSTDEAKTNSISEEHVKNAIEYMQFNYHKNITINEIANYLHIDPGYLYNLFIKYLNISPKEYLNRLRYEVSCKMLNETSLSVSEIAESIGYSDPFACSKFFKNKSTMSPTKYRNKNK